MSKLSKDKRDKLILTCMAIVMVGGLWWTFVIGAQQDAIADYTKKIAGLRDKVDKAERLSRLGPIIQANLEKSRKNLDIKQEMMSPASGQRYWFLKLLDQFKKPYGVDLLDITQPTEEELGLLPKFPFKAAVFGVKASAQYHEFGKFVADFENAFPYMAIRNIRMDPEGNKGLATSSGTLSASGSPGSEGAGGQGAERLNIEFKVVTLVKPVL